MPANLLFNIMPDTLPNVIIRTLYTRMCTHTQKDKIITNLDHYLPIKIVSK